MKHYIQTLLLCLCVGLGLASCADDDRDELTGMYEAPSLIEADNVVDEGRVKLEEGYVFHVLIPSTDNLHLAFAGNKYYLEGGSYGVYSSSTLQASTILADSSYVERNGERRYLDHGTVSVAQTDSLYAFTGIVWLNDGSAFKINASGKLVYIDDAPVISPYSYKDEATLASADVMNHQLSLYDADGNRVALVGIRTAVNATTLAGEYNITSQLDPAAAGQAVPGFDLSILGLGKFGTIFVEDGTEYLVQSGTIRISEKDGLLSIDITNMASVTADGGTATTTSLSFQNVPKLSPYTATDAVNEETGSSGIYTHNVTLRDESGNVAASFALRNASATAGDVVGDYVVADAVTSATPAAGQAVMGIDLSILGLGNLGCYLVDGGSTYYVQSGNISVKSINGKLYITGTDIVSATGSGAQGSTSFQYDNVPVK